MVTRVGSRSAVAMRPTLHRVLLVVAVVLFLIYALIGAGWVKSTHPDAWLGFGLAAFAGSLL
jgi:hypothetical protein